MWTLRRPEGRDAQRRDELIKVLGGDATLGLPGMWFFWANPYDIITAWRKVGIAGNKLAPEMIDRSEFIDQPAPMAALATPGAAEPASPRVARKRAADLAMTPEGMVSGSLESERAKVQRLLGHAQELEAMVEAPFDPTAAGLLVPDVVTRPDKEVPGGGRKRLTVMHGSVTMQGVGEEAEQREREAKELAAAVKAKSCRPPKRRRQRRRLSRSATRGLRFARSRAHAGSPRAHMPSGSGARDAVPRTASARSGRAWLHASHSCWATRRRWGCWRDLGRQWKVWMPDGAL